MLTTNIRDHITEEIFEEGRLLLNSFVRPSSDVIGSRIALFDSKNMPDDPFGDPGQITGTVEIIGWADHHGVNGDGMFHVEDEYEHNSEWGRRFRKGGAGVDPGEPSGMNPAYDQIVCDDWWTDSTRYAWLLENPVRVVDPVSVDSDVPSPGTWEVPGDVVQEVRDRQDI